MCDLTTEVLIEVNVWLILPTGFHGTGQLLLFTVERAVRTIGGGHAGLQAAAGTFDVRSPSLITHH